MSTTHFASLNFLSKSAFKRAVADGLPIVLFSPDLKLPAVNGPARVEGPWPRTAAPIEDLPCAETRRFATPTAHRAPDGKLVKPRERVKPWYADVEVRDMRVTIVH